MGQQGSRQMHPSLNQQFTELGYWLLQDWCYILVFNDGVGADYVQKEKVVPRGIGSNDVGLRCASLDGDADHFVYFSVSTNSSRKFDLVDGDKMLSLFALFIKDQPRNLAKDGNEKPNNNSQARLGVVQTAYANGASADYLKQLGLEVIFTPTGVKHLHEKAAQFDIGILDLPSRQLKVKVVDGTAVATTNAETVAVRSPGIQAAIDAEAVKYHKGRCFIRPSGTEDVIRVYAEASTQEAADSLVNSVAKIVDRFLGSGTSQQ
ncbi:hypothetical protein CXB51_000134 [Gossypium anomalum]|uniref:Alpha-D-phosphohexomutase C-terminal domain-containing protein n=1 Tax=Gossypium anomalum TaxID=47600 RepID=A0A8J6DEH3_9ROSI|nr:hypothetical protein CXB51_000134 [Gossypium anomalum]